MTLLLSLLFVCASAMSQSRDGGTEKFRIHGVVLDISSVQPIEGVEVWLASYQEAGESTPAVSKGYQTGRSGTFDFELTRKGSYNLEPRKEGYIVPGPMVRGYGPAVTDVLVDGTKPDQEVWLFLARPAGVSGRVVDAENKQPVAKAKIHAVLAFYQDGQRRLSPTSMEPAVTDTNGRFHIQGLVPGPYFIEVEPEPNLAPGLSRIVADEERKKTDFGYGRMYWPPGGNPESAPPFTLDSGADLDLGFISISQAQAYRAVVHVSGENCAATGKLNAELSQSLVGPPFREALGEVPCDGEFLIRGLSPGSYDLDVYGDLENPALRQLGHASFEIVASNLENLNVASWRGVNVFGKAAMADNTQRILPDGLSIRLLPVRRTLVPTAYNATVESGGKFFLPNVDLRPQRIRLDGLGKGYFIKSIEYNGRKISDGILQLNPLSPSHSLTIALSDRPATLRGRVMESDNPTRNLFVLLTRWPATRDDYYSQFLSAKGDADGKFVFSGLAPGDYRILAVRLSDGDRLDEPGVLPSAMERAKQVTLAEGTVMELTLEPARP